MIEVQGKKLKYNMYAMEKLQEKNAAGNSTYQTIYAMVYAGLHGYAFAAEMPVTETWSDIIDFSDGLTEKELTEINIELANSVAYKRLVQPTDTKKKPVKPTT